MVEYSSTTGDFTFTRKSDNPAALASAVSAQLSGYLTQLNSYNQAFTNIDTFMLMPRRERLALKLKNRYAASDGNLIYNETMSHEDNDNLWVRPYTTFEKVPLKGGIDVSNISYGTFFGGDSKFYDLGHGWDASWGLYAGYNGARQNYDNVTLYQNGGTLGVIGALYKGDFFTALTLNAGANGVQANTMYGKDYFAMIMSGIASKSGYNFEMLNGKLIVQPSFMISYSNIVTPDYTNKSGIKIENKPLNVLEIEPALRLIGNFENGLQPYLGVSMVWNLIDKARVTANDTALTELSIKPYVRYGLGIQKRWGKNATGFFQAFVTQGGRNGVGLQAGLNWLLGKEIEHKKLTSSPIPDKGKTEIKLSRVKFNREIK